MRALRSRGGWVGIKLAAASLLALAAALLTLTLEGSRSRVVAENPSKLEASIFSYDGKDFIRTKTTLTDAQGKSAVNTRLDHNSLAYKALAQKHSYVGPSEVFGKKYDADYAPLVSDDGKLTGALFVGSPR
jgi:Cache 3/Cache 2 fusion domain